MCPNSSAVILLGTASSAFIYEPPVSASAAVGIMNKTVEQKQTKAMDMRSYWLHIQDQVEQGQFRVYWAPGKYNLAH